MEKLSRNSDDFSWIGERIDKPRSPGKKSYYKSFTYNCETYKIHDFVMVKTEYGGQKLCELLSFYEACSTYARPRGMVRWYPKAGDLPRAITAGIQFDRDNEVVADFRNSNTSISLEQVLFKCSLIYAAVGDPIHIITDMNLDKNIHFSCRYRIETNKLIDHVLNMSTDELVRLSNLEITPKFKRKSSSGSKYVDENEVDGVNIQNNTKPSPIRKSHDSVLTPNRAKRNLNESFDYTPNSQTDTSVVNYSVVEMNDEEKKPFVLKLRVSSRKNSLEPRVFLRKLDDEMFDNLVKRDSFPKSDLVKQSIIENDVKVLTTNCGVVRNDENDELEICKVEAPRQKNLPKSTKNQLNIIEINDEDSNNTLYTNLRPNRTPKKLETRRSSRAATRKSYVDFISPTKLTPRRTRYQSYENYLIIQQRTPSKKDEVHRTPSKRTRSTSVTFEQDVKASPAKRSSKKTNHRQSTSKTHSERIPVILENISDEPISITPIKTSSLPKRTPSKYSNISAVTSPLKPNRPKRSICKPLKYLEESDLAEILYPLEMEPRTPRSRKKSEDQEYSLPPKKRITRTISATPKQSTSPKKRAAKSPMKSVPTTPTKNNALADEFVTPKKVKRTDKAVKTPKNTPGSRMKLIRAGVITPSMQMRKTAVVSEGTPLKEAREKLHVSYVPEALPCREKEYSNVLTFVQGKLFDGCGGCMYVSGVPGTGKTATVTEVIKNLQRMVKTEDLPEFSYVNVNGMRLTEPRQAYVEILKQLTGKTVPWEQAQTMLEDRFTKSTGGKKKLPVVLLVDELDILCTKRQDVVYNLLDWPTKAKAQLIVITIANTMDLPERLLMGRVTSRLGLTRLTFQAYTHKQLQEIVMKRLTGTGAFNPDAVQLVARKVASVSGDARRALDICRRAAEIAELQGDDTLVSMGHVNEALNGMITQPKVLAIKHCRRLEQLILQSVATEVERTGVDETTFADVYTMLQSVAGIDGFKMVSISIALAAVSRLGACRLLLTEHKSNDLHQRLILNVSADDIYYALRRDRILT